MSNRTREAKLGACLAVMLTARVLSDSHLPAQVGRSPERVIAFRNVNVIPMDTEQIRVNQTVIVRNATIERSGPADQIAVPREATTIEGRGAYLLPGLADMHAHLASPSDPPGTAEAELMLFLAHGVTTVRNMRGFASHLSLRDRVARRELAGPAIITAGPGLDGEAVKSPAEGKKAVEDQKRQGYDLIKVLPGLTRSAYDAIARTAHQAGIPFGGHIPGDVGLIHAFEMGQQTVEHLDGYLELLNGSTTAPRDKVAEVVRRTTEAGIWNVPTMAVMEANLGLIDDARLLSRPELEYVPEVFVNQWLKIRSFGNPPKAVSDVMEQNRSTLMKALSDVNARILLGTDSPQLFNVPGFSMRREIRIMADAGLRPYVILRSATVRAGEYTGRSCGTIKPGQRADLLLLEGNPLADLQNLDRVVGVMAGGRWLPSAELQRRLRAIRERPDRYRIRAG